MSADPELHHTSNCAVCAYRNKETKLETGRCCPRHQTEILNNINAIEQAVLFPHTRTSTGGSRTAEYESKPPLHNLNTLDPHSATFKVGKATATVCEIIESWTRNVREYRGYSAYGLATENQWSANEITSRATNFTWCISVLRSEIPWMTTDPTFPLDDFADELRHLRDVIRQFESETTDLRRVDCPTTDCTGIIWVSDTHRNTHCRNCGAIRDTRQLLAAAGKDAAYADADALAEWFSISVRTIRRWKLKGLVRAKNSLYNVGDVERQANPRRRAT